MASLEAQINQYTTEIEGKEAEIKDLWTQLEGADEAKARRLEQRIRARGLQRQAGGPTHGFGGQVAGCVWSSSASTLTTNTPVASCISPGSLLSLHGALQLLLSHHGDP
jgi:hypothetical protein